jgi:hypothetical protein
MTAQNRDFLPAAGIPDGDGMMRFLSLAVIVRAFGGHLALEAVRAEDNGVDVAPSKLPACR